jgi:predicted dehydrogenase
VSYYRRSLPRFIQIKKWIDSKSIGEVRHIDGTSKPTTEQDMSDSYNWRTEKLQQQGTFDLASHGLDLVYTFRKYEASGMSLNQQGLYSAKDAVSASWLHESGITGSGSWNFGSYRRRYR